MEGESVKVARVGYAQLSTVTQEKIPIEVGLNEYALLLAIKVFARVFDGALGSAWNYIALYRKTEKTKLTVAGDFDLTGTWQEDNSIIDYWYFYLNEMTQVGYLEYYKQMYQVYPTPIKLIRPPSLVSYSTTNNKQGCIVWYKIVKTSKEEIAKLMAKDHA